MTEFLMSKDDFGLFMRCLLNLKEICNDVDIRNGIIRQRTSDLTSVFEMDLTSLIQNSSIPITALKKKLDAYKTFSFGGDEIQVSVFEGENESASFYTFIDGQYKYRNLFPSLEFMDNKFMSEEERDNIFNVEPDNLIIQTELGNLLTDRIRFITDNFQTQALQVKFSGDTATIGVATTSKDQFIEFQSGIVSNIEFDGDYFANLSAIPFRIDHDTSLNFSMYKDPEKNLTHNLVKTSIGNVTLNVYSRAALVEDSD